MLISTMNDVPGYRVTRVYGEVFGLTVRSRNVFSQAGAGLKSVFGGELKGMTKMLEDSRQEVLGRLGAAAEAVGANAVVSMRFDTSDLGQTWSEICAYGTAVFLEAAG
ncbi:MAG TPA: YbjQ family protein [Acidimicrobiales bacterium]|nr:YbjQ family protein [Acidimicrobiales bacterium]